MGRFKWCIPKKWHPTCIFHLQAGYTHWAQIISGFKNILKHYLICSGWQNAIMVRSYYAALYVLKNSNDCHLDLYFIEGNSIFQVNTMRSEFRTRLPGIEWHNVLSVLLPVIAHIDKISRFWSLKLTIRSLHWTMVWNMKLSHSDISYLNAQ